VIDFLKRLFGQSGSSSAAKERLRLVLMTDHLELAPEMVDAMKRDLVDVISRYVEVDRERIDVTFEQQDRTLAMLANIPILSVGRTNGHAANSTLETAPEPVVAVAAAVASNGTAAPADGPPVTPAKRKRRRRKKAKGAAVAAAAP
jgi:cell division topological specificity factor